MKCIGIALAILIALLMLAAAIIAATFDPNDYKPWIIQQVAEKKQRTLAIPGEIKLSFFPKLGVDLGQVSLSERNSSKPFVSVEQAKVALALMPLLRKQMVVDRISIDGLKADIRRTRQGATNFDDLLAQEEAPASGAKVAFDIDSVAISNAHIRYDDQQAQRTVELASLDLQTDKIANGVPSKLSLKADIKSSKPAIAANLDIRTGFTVDLDTQQYLLRNADARIKGSLFDVTDAVLQFAGNADLQPAAKRFALDDVKLALRGKRAAQQIDARLDAPRLVVSDTAVTGGKLNGQATITEGPRTLALQFSAPSFEGSPQAFKVPAIALDAAIRDGKLDANAKITGSISGDIDKLLFGSPQLKLALAGKQADTAIDGTLTTGLMINLAASKIDLSNIAAAFALPNPAGGTLKLNAAGQAHLNLATSSLNAALKGKLDESSFDARFGMPRFSPAAYSFDINIDRIDADRYRSKTAAAPARQPGQPAAEKPIDLSALRELSATGSVRIGALKVNNLRATNVRADVRAGEGTLALPLLAANLYGGSTSGALSATASQAPRYSVRQNLTGIHVGPLMQDAIGKSPIEGRGNVSLDVTSAGGSFALIRKSLQGSARLELRDGAIRGINVAQVIRTAKAKAGELRGKESAQSGTASTAEKTDFSEMTGSFRIANGIARNDDLVIKSPLMRIGGAGDINLGDERLDYLVRATIVSTLQGQGGPELQAVKGLTIPVRLSGPFAAIGWRVDVESLVREAARQKFDEKKEELKTRARDELQERLKDLFGKPR